MSAPRSGTGTSTVSQVKGRWGAAALLACWLLSGVAAAAAAAAAPAPAATPGLVRVHWELPLMAMPSTAPLTATDMTTLDWGSPAMRPLKKRVVGGPRSRGGVVGVACRGMEGDWCGVGSWGGVGGGWVQRCRWAATVLPLDCLGAWIAGSECRPSQPARAISWTHLNPDFSVGPPGRIPLQLQRAGCWLAGELDITNRQTAAGVNRERRRSQAGSRGGCGGGRGRLYCRRGRRKHQHAHKCGGQHHCAALPPAGLHRSTQLGTCKCRASVGAGDISNVLCSIMLGCHHSHQLSSTGLV